MIYAVLLAAILLLAMTMNPGKNQTASKSITYSELLSMISDHRVNAVAIQGEHLYGLTTQNAAQRARFPDAYYDFDTVIGSDFLYTVRQMVAKEKGVDVDTVSVDDLGFAVQYRSTSTRSWWIDYLPLLLEIVFIGVMWFMIFRVGRKNNAGGLGGAANFSRSRAKVVNPSSHKVTFADVAGAEEEKEELAEMVDFLRNPKAYKDVGARIPKGVLLVGPPGTGKTLLAKAVAGEANVPFFSISGSDFVEMFVGVGASRVRDLFDQAKKAAPAIVFIDEIDAVGRHRGAGLGGGHDEREQTLNQLLVEMDGFEANTGVIVMAATNRRDILDPALLRPGRFDRQVTVNYPDQGGRVEILKVHSRGKPLAEDVDLVNIAKRLPYGTGADIENVMNEAAILAARSRKDKIDQQLLIDAIARVQMGPEKKSHKVSEKDRYMVAVHESGHAVLGHLVNGCDEVHLVTIVPRGGSGGHTLSLPSEERDNMSRTQMLAFVTMALGGHAAEEVILGEIYTGSSSDLKTATEMCRQMVTKYGMSDAIGTVYLGSDQEVFVGMEFGQNRQYSEEIAAAIDKEVRRMLKECYEKAKSVILENRDKLDRLVQALLREETVGRQEFVALMDGQSAGQAVETVPSQTGEDAEKTGTESGTDAAEQSDATVTESRGDI